MEKMIILGGRPLIGEVTCSGSKNAALPILAATILADGECNIGSVPVLKDVDTLQKILAELGVRTERRDGRIYARVVDDSKCVAPYELVSQMRGSICTLGPLLARRRRACVSLPGGCVIGDRPIDLHLKGLEALGAKIKIQHGYICATAKRLKGAEIYLGGPAGSSVLGTANIMMAACMAEGRTIIEHAACEPEVEDLARFLKKMGAKIHGAGSHRIVINGVSKLQGCKHDVIPDRIEAGTWIAAAAATHGNVWIRNCRPEHMSAVISCFRDAGISIEARGNGLNAVMEGRPREVEATMLPYPGFPTDMQPQLMTVLSMADGASVITDAIYPDRFMHAAELCRLGARIRRVGSTAVIIGCPRLQGAPVMASDLRAAAALVIAGLAASGETQVRRIYHADRGYENLDKKLKTLGAEVRREEDSVEPMPKPPADLIELPAHVTEEVAVSAE